MRVRVDEGQRIETPMLCASSIANPFLNPSFAFAHERIWRAISREVGKLASSDASLRPLPKDGGGAALL